MVSASSENTDWSCQFTHPSSSVAAQCLGYSRCSINAGGANTFMNNSPFNIELTEKGQPVVAHLICRLMVVALKKRNNHSQGLLLRPGWRLGDSALVALSLLPSCGQKLLLHLEKPGFFFFEAGEREVFLPPGVFLGSPSHSDPVPNFLDVPVTLPPAP